MPLKGRRTKWATDECRNRGNARVKVAREGGKADQRDRLLRCRYNITQEEYETILEFQDGKCALCGKANSRYRNHHVDHDHKTLVVRGILCFRCNVRVLGKLSLPEVEAAVEYLKDPPAIRALGKEVIASPKSNSRRKKRQPRKRAR